MQLDRYHGLDALRAATMLLGLVYHSAPFYMTSPPMQFGDRQQSFAFDLLFYFIHFRMPLFFLLAGFFGALLYQRRGPRAFVRNRVARVLIPLLVLWIVVVPPGSAAVAFSAGEYGVPMTWSPLLPDQPFWRQPVLGILWFLWDLLLFYAAALVLQPFVRRLPGALKEAAARAFHGLAGAFWAPVALAAVTFPTLLPMQWVEIDRSFAIVPYARELIAYGLFFTFGWHLYRERRALHSFAERWVMTLAAGAAVGIAYAVVVSTRPALSPQAFKLAIAALLSLSLWLLAFGTIGVFLRYLTEPRPGVRYLADASYWMFLMHAVPAFAVPGLLADFEWPAVVKFGIVLGVTVASTLVSYHYLVRPTAIGEMLNGRRHPRVPIVTLWRRSSFARGPSSPASSL